MAIWTDWNSTTATINCTNVAWDTWIYRGTISQSTSSWTTWCTTTTNTTETTSGSAWITWIDSSSESHIVQPRELTAEERAESERRAEEYREQQRIEAEKYRAAKERAEGFLYEHLTDEQRAQLKREKFFVVVGGKSKKRYKIDGSQGFAGNVAELDGAGREVRRFCAHLEHAANAPVFDHWLAQKLMLQHREDDFLAIANRRAVA